MSYEYVHASLALPLGQLGPLARPRRLAAIHEADGWPAGPNPENPVLKTVYSGGVYEVCLGKPGKEWSREGQTQNLYDMLPCVRKEGKRLDYTPSFGDIFGALQKLGRADEVSLELLGCLFVRSAFMLDHEKLAAGWRFSPPEEVLRDVEARTPQAGGIPVGVFLQLVDALAWNEDVKYFHRNGDISNTGRPNTLMTCAHIIAVMLGRAELVSFANALSRGRGVAPLPQQRARGLFPPLSPAALLVAEDTKSTGRGGLE